MLKSRIKKPVAMLLAVVMVLPMLVLISGDVAAAPGDMWDLNNFITGVTMEDPSTSPPTPVNPGDTVFLGQNYIFTMTFAETSQRQLAYNAGGRLLYQLPSSLTITTAVPQSPIFFGTGTVRVGWYTIDTSGLVQVWFDNVNNSGNPTPGNFIDNYTNVQFRLQITAQFTEGGDGSLDFGNGIEVTVPPPATPPPRLTVVKSSSVDVPNEVINYTIVITAYGDTINNIAFTDTPGITNSTGSHGIANPLTNNAFYGFRYALNGNTNFIPINVNWLHTTPPPAAFTYLFGPAVSLEPGEFITVYYSLDIQRLIENNPALVPDPLVYDFYITNGVGVTSNAPGVSDDDSERVQKTFPISKSGSYSNDPAPHITWTVTVGESSATSNTNLDDKTITDTLGPDLWLPDPSLITIDLFFRGNTTTTPDVSTTAADTNFDLVLSTNPTPPVGPPYNEFSITVPSASTYTESIYKMQIIYNTDVTNPPENKPGFPPTVYQNNVVDDAGHGSVGRVPFTPPVIPITKTSSGLCGNPTDGYYLTYDITVEVPAGLYEQELWLYDTLGRLPGGTGVGNTPVNFNITAVPAAGSPPLGVPLLHTDPIITGAYDSAWRVYLGTDVPPAPYDTGFPGPGTPQWQWNFAVTLHITYRIDLDQATVDFLKTLASNSISNTIYVINGPGEPHLSGNAQNSVGGKSANDSWPISKKGTPSDNPALFNYAVTINGAYSARPNSLFQTAPPALSPKNPVFSDSFDPRLVYVPGTFYVWDSGTNQFYAPAVGSDVITGTNSFSINFNTLWQYTSPPSPTGSSAPGGTPIGTGPADSSWYTGRRNYVVHYQLRLRDANLNAPQTDLTNNATIAVAPNECTFDNSFMEAYTPQPITKDMATNGSAITDVTIIINPTGGILFSDGTNPGPAQITARDTLTNLMVYLDQITVYTQTRVGGYWDGIWVPQPVTYNDKALWSINVVSNDILDFILPNQQPIMIEYEALVTLGDGETGPIKNELNIFGQIGEDGDNTYIVSDTTAGATADLLNLRVFKRDPNPDMFGNIMFLPGAEFTLYVADLDNPGLPPTGVTSTPVNIGGIAFFPLVLNQVTNSFGMTIFEDPYINTTFDFLFMLEETAWPPGYTAGGGSPYTFFTIKPNMDSTMFNNAQTALNPAIINQVSDYITIDNTPDPARAGSLRLWKQFTGIDISDPHYQQLLQNFRITITDPDAVQHVYTLAQAMDPLGIVIENAMAGTYFIQETGATLDGYTWDTIPPLLANNTLRVEVNLYDYQDREVLIQLNNVYTIPPVEVPPGVIVPPETLFIIKEINGLTPALIQQHLQDFQIVITGPGGFNKTIGLIDALNGYAFNDVLEGTYFFNEINTGVPGFTLTTEPQIPFRRYIMPTTSRGIVIRISNTYTPIPPDVPKTGDTRSIIVPGIILGAGVVLIVGAEFYRRHNKKSKDTK